MRKKITLLAAMLLLLLASCEKAASDEGDFAKLYVELRIAAQEFGDTEVGAAEKSRILKKYNYDAQKFEAELNNVKENADNWKVFQSAVVSALDSINNNL